jgi:arginyl-tRNA synthetase
MWPELKSQLRDVIVHSLSGILPADHSASVELEIPAEKSHGDLSSTIALKSAKILRESPMVIAEKIKSAVLVSLSTSPLKNSVQRVEVKAPGFVNFFFSPQVFFQTIDEIYEKGSGYGRSAFGKKEKIQIEFVSANPTGPLSVAHARQAAVGDILGNVLSFIGFDVTKEYYVNDEGNQINILGHSIRLRALEILGQKIEFPEDHYQGEYIKDMAAEFMKRQGIKSAADIDKLTHAGCMKFGVDYLMNVITQELADFGVKFNVWSYQSKVADNQTVARTLDELKKNGFIYEKDGAMWFESTRFGDDKDRVVKKSDGSFTYLAPDIVYHQEKFSRGFSRIFNIWGPDHHGYIPRIKAAAQALGKDKDSVEVLIVQLATIYRNGEEVSMSTRRGQFISLREVMEDVGVDAARFFFLMRHIKSHLEFDLDLAKKETAENPVYYIQYAHARVHSINRKAKEMGVIPVTKNFSNLNSTEELELIKKLAEFPETLIVCYEQRDPYPLTAYLHELAISFHRFYDLHRVIDTDVTRSAERLGLVNAVRIVLANGLALAGLEHPESM